jgi:hypothetical protein
MKKMSAKGNAASAEARTASAAKRAADLLQVISGLQDDGFDSIVGIAAKQNERGITAARGGTWSAVQVRRVLMCNENTALAHRGNENLKLMP